MRLLVIGFAVVLTASLAGTVWANEPVAGSVQSGETIGVVFEGRSDFVEGWNVDRPFDGSWFYGAACQGPVYRAGATYWLDRIEFMAGVLPGTAVIEVRADDGSGCPTGPILSSGSFEQVVEVGWQGADLSPCVLIEEGVTYCIKYKVVVDSPSSFATGGVIIPHCWSWDCYYWEGPASSFFWMAKFFGGDMPSAADESTWGSVKVLYR